MLQNEMILASAGSGKTYQLTNRYIGLMALQLLSGAKVTPERIIAVTFTRKAAGEFFDSILEKLAKAASDPDEIGKFASGDDLISESLSRLTPAQYTELLRNFINRMPRLFLGTLDSFYSNVLRSFPSEFGLTGDFDIIDQHMESLARDEVYRTVFRRTIGGKGDSDAAQREFLESFRQATFGKEEYRIRTELDRYISDLHNLYLEQPDEKRWGRAEAIWPGGSGPFLGVKTDLKKEFDQLFSAFEDNAVTIHQAYWEEFREDALEHQPGSKPSTRVGYMFNRLLPLWPELKEGHLSVKFGRTEQEFGPTECRHILRILQHLAGAEIQLRLQRTHGVWQLLDRYESAYAEKVRRQGKLTFQDLALLLAPSGDDPSNATALLFQTPGEDDRLRIDYRLDSRYDHWLLDEFQDTSFLQWRVIENLIDETIQDTSGERSLFQVGDIKQSIYGWRGGDPTLFRDIERRYNAHEKRIARRNLDVSWRSGHDVIDPVNRVFGVPAVFEELDLPKDAIDRWEWSEHSVSPRGESLPGYTALINPVPPEGSKAEDEDRFAVVLEILKEMDPIRRGIECAILVQTNNNGRKIVDYLRSYLDIPIMNEADISVATDNALNRAVLSYLQLGAHPCDSFSWEHLRLTPFLSAIEKEELTPASLSARVRKSIFEHGFETTVRSFIRTLGETPGLTLDEFSIRRGEELALAARLYDREGRRDIDEFISFARSHSIKEPDARSAVQVMTIHKSKGLTFDAVILPDLEGNSLSSARTDIGASRNEAREIEWIFDLPAKDIYQADDVLRNYHAGREADAAFENLCKLYVAMTRARCANYLITNPRSGRSSSNNFVKLLETALADSDPREDSLGDCSVKILYETSLPATNRNWYETRSSAPESEEKPDSEHSSVDQSLARVRVGRRTPSGSEKAVVTASQIFSKEGKAAREFGTLVHSLFEDIEWYSESQFVTLLERWESLPGYSQEIRQAAIDQVTGSLNEISISQALAKPAEPAECWRERNFEILLDNEWLSGTFDRAVIRMTPDGKAASATILDFKTDHVESDEALAAAIEKYRPQLETYRKVLSRMTGLEDSFIGLQLLFTRRPQLVTL